MSKYASYEQRFYEKIEHQGDCWIWVGAITSKGYGSIAIDGKSTSAHRYSYILHNGQIPKGMYVCHSCDVRSCVNPKHLWVGTPKDNNKDMVLKGRSVPSPGNPNGYNQYRKRQD